MDIMTPKGQLQTQFTLRVETSFGESMYVLGNAKELGNWQLPGATALTTDAGHYPVWTSKPVTITASLPLTLEYKYVKVRDGRLVQWEPIQGNHRIDIQCQPASLLVTADIWSLQSDPIVVNDTPDPVEFPAEEVTTEDDLISHLATLNASHVSWRRKLEVVHSLITSTPLDESAIGVIAGYCHFLSAGNIPCEEDGSHYRPNNHASLSKDITTALLSLQTPSNSLLIRQILATLPSYQPAFTASVPLTRIRDIAHRGDIPQDFKREIKTTLQNKLHRCAGPEDLITCENIIKKAKRLQLNDDFMREIELFYTELKEFFNATELEEKLEKLANEMTDLREYIETFLREKEAKSRKREQFLTELRRKFADLQGLELHEAQHLLITDIELTSFAYSCFSERINSFGESLIPEKYQNYADLIDKLLENLFLSKYEPEECEILRKEFGLHRSFPATFSSLLRLKATCERALRLTCDYSNQVTEVQPRVNELGKVLRIDRRAVAVFSEGLIRSQLPFQLSKIVTMVLKLVKKTGNFSPWLPIYTGKCKGNVVVVRDMEQVRLQEPAIVVVQRVDGDEEVPPGLVGLIVAHDLPQLSHLAVRLRQAKVVSAACDSPEDLSRLRQLSGYGELTVTGKDVRLVETTKVEVRTEEQPSQVVVSTADVTVGKVITAEKAEQSTCGAKAYMAGRLEAFSRTLSGFVTPKSVCIPFGIYSKFIPNLPQESRTAALEYMEKRLSTMSSDFEGLTQSIMQRFQDCARPLIFRSSANVEDTASVSGAGLYDSIPNISPTNPQQISEAIAEVWRSIATERAWKSREYHRLPHASALMGILVQELITPKYAFVVHTQSPFGVSEEAYIEMTYGLGETLASGDQRGSPYRLTYNKSTRVLTTLALASYSFSLMPSSSGIERIRMDYSTEDLTEVQRLGGLIGQVSAALETELQCPQDIEGVVAEDQIWLVQTRPQV